MLLNKQMQKQPLLIVKLQRPHPFQAYLPFKQKTAKSNFDQQKASQSLTRMILKRQKNQKNLQFFKKELKTHEKSIKQSPRIKLIQTTKKLIAPSDYYNTKGLGDSQQLMVIKSIEESEKGSANLKQQQKKTQYLRFRKMNQLGISTSIKAKQKNKIVKGCTYRFQNYLKQSANSLIGYQRRSVQLEKYYSEFDYRQQIGQQNQEVQSQKGNYLTQKNSPQKQEKKQSINIFESIYRRKDLSLKMAQSLGAEYSKIQRNKNTRVKQSQQNYRFSSDQEHRVNLKQFSLTNAGFPMSSGFPMKKIQINQPQVLTIKMKRGVQNRQRKSADKSVRNNRQYYLPNRDALRPSTTMMKSKDRRNSQIEPW